MKYFINSKEVTKKEYINAEKMAGFHPKVEGETATASFGNGMISGYTRQNKIPKGAKRVRLTTGEYGYETKDGKEIILS